MRGEAHQTSVIATRARALNNDVIGNAQSKAEAVNDLTGFCRIMDSSPIIHKLSNLIQVIEVLAEDAVYYKSSCQHVAASMSLLKAPLDELHQCQMPWNVDELSTFNMLEFTCLKLKELLESCSGRASKSILVLRKQQVFKELSAKLQSLLRTLPLDTLSLSRHSKELVRGCVSSLESANFCTDVDRGLVEEVECALAEIRKGTKLSHEMLVHLADKLGLKSNQEILKEASLLEKEKNLAHLNRNKNDEELLNLLILLVTQMSDDLAEQKHLQAQEDGVIIPADLRCPLSLELMSDPVIVASGQTYERAYIQQWLDQGNTTCPKSRQTLNHFNLINNFTVKALIASWCEQNGVPLPEPTKPQLSAPRSSPVQMSDAIQRSAEHVVSLLNREHVVASRSGAESVRTIPRRRDEPEIRRETRSQGSSVESRGILHGHLRAAFLERPDRDSTFSLERENSRNGVVSLSRNTSTSSHGSSIDDAVATSNTESNVSLPSMYPPHSCDVSGELNRLTISSASVSSLSEDQGMQQTDGEHGLVSIIHQTAISGSETGQNVQLDASTEENGGDDIQFKVQGLVRNLQSMSQDMQRNAATELRLLAKFNVENRIIIADSGAIPPLISLLHSTDPQIQENAVTALLNLSINNNNKSEIAAANAIGPLVHVLNVGTSEARENAAATLFSLSVMNENKMTIGQSGAIDPLVDLLTNGTPRGKKDAATALFNLSILHENKIRIVGANAVRPLVRLMSDPAAGMVDKAVAVIANLATIHEGRVSIGEEEGIPVLVEVVEMGSQRGKENAAAALLHLCTSSNRFKSRVLQEGVIPPLVALTRSGTARAKEKASALLRLFREQRHGRGADTHGCFGFLLCLSLRSPFVVVPLERVFGTFLLLIKNPYTSEGYESLVSQVSQLTNDMLARKSDVLGLHTEINSLRGEVQLLVQANEDQGRDFDKLSKTIEELKAQLSPISNFHYLHNRHICRLQSSTDNMKKWNFLSTLD
ncbi:hypothetical protein GOP47_0007444 [Adiantum capillus-veneris]|uniref:U-box domain-containing protein 12 n=1 Tax=Adiantum capillus-veneris TaxID=13818 RepID=A0A9D4ZLX8_ADICA|nr:hypothetical protein GOP47_0007444 [Adiantum capillus-veneris]